MSGRPLDVLEAAVGDEVEVRLKSGETYRGILAGYDQHMNLVLDDVSVATAAGDDLADEGGSAGDADGSDESGDVGGAEPPADGQDTTIIRGDNVVSITP